MITDHNGCWLDDVVTRIGRIGVPRDFLGNVNDICITGDAICLDEGREACDITPSCEGLSIYSGVQYAVNMYNSSAFNDSNPCNGKYGLAANLQWNVYRKISSGNVALTLYNYPSTCKFVCKDRESD